MQQRTNREIADIYDRHAETVYRVCILFFHGSAADAEDAVQTTFLRLLGDATAFSSAEHEKAWLIVTASNVCRDMRKSAWHRRVVPDGELLHSVAAPETDSDALRAVMELPDRYKAAVYLHYCEGYSCKEIARFLGRAEPSVWRYLRRGRDILKRTLGEGE